MREFKALSAANLPEGFDAELHTEEPIVEVKETPGNITINYAFPGFYLVDDEQEIDGEKAEFKQLHIKSTGSFGGSGKPQLPSFGRYVQIPANADYQLTVKKSRPIEFGDVVVAPAQTTISDNPNQKHELEFDKDFYLKDVQYPEDVVMVTGPHVIDDRPVLLVNVTPLQYNPAKKKVVGFSNISVSLELKERKGDAARSVSDSPKDDEALGNLLLNPGQRISQKMGFAIPQLTIRAVGPELLVIYAKVFERAAQKLAAWKNHRGLLTEIACIDTVGNSVTQLKNYIRGRRGLRFARLRYVLLIGDGDMIVTQSTLNNGGPLNCLYGVSYRPDMKTATDYYYSTQFDQDNPDPAHPNQVLFYPWLSIGRIPVRPDIEGPPASGDSQAQSVVDQIIAYEKTPPADPDFYKRMTFAAFFQGTNHKDTRGYLTTIEGIRANMESLGYTTDRVYVTNDTASQLYYQDGSPIPAGVVSAIVSDSTATQMLIAATTEGQLFFGHRDHGNWDGWVHPSFRNSSLDQVTGDMPSVFYSINCETAGFDYNEPTECFAEKNLRMRGTAPSLIGATRDSGTYMNNDLIRGIFDATFGGVIPTFPGGNASYRVNNSRLGDILNYAKSYLPIVNPGNDAGVKDEWEIYHVIGDPTLEMWTALPRVIGMTAKIVQRNLDIQLSACPRGTVITLWFGDKLLKRLEPACTHITVPLAGLTPIALPKPPLLKPYVEVCLWAPGNRFTGVRVPIAQQRLAAIPAAA